MKKKSLTIILAILTFIIVIVVLSSTVFSLSSVSLDMMSNNVNIAVTSQELIDSGNFKMGESVFFIHKNTYISNLETANPYLKVVNLETVFPNKLVIHAVERNEYFVVKVYDENDTFKYYAVLDEEFKVLRTLSSYTFYKTGNIQILDENAVYKFKENDVKLGQKLDMTNLKNLNNLQMYLRQWQDNVTLLKANIDKIVLNYDNIENSICIEMVSGLKIFIKDCTDKFEDKVVLGLSFYNNASTTQKENGKITVLTVNDGVQGFYTAS